MAREVDLAADRSGAPCPPPGKMTYEEFLDWLDEDTRAEWVDGEVILLSPASRVHQRLLGFLYRLLSEYLDQRDVGELLLAPFQMKTSSALPGREPDLLFVAQENLGRIRGTYLDGPADLVVEIVSPDSVSRDRQDKLQEYERGGVSEYWLIDPRRRQAEFFHLGEDRSYHPIPPGEGGILRSRVLPGLWIRSDWLWTDPLPNYPDIRKELGLS